MNKDDLIKYIRNTPEKDLTEMYDMVKSKQPSNINNKYFRVRDEYIHVIDSEFYSDNTYFVYGVSVYVDTITINSDLGPIVVDESEEISKEEFMEEYNKVLTMIEQNLPFKKRN